MRWRVKVAKSADPLQPNRKMGYKSGDAPVAQLDRALVSETKGRTFESSRAHFQGHYEVAFSFWCRKCKRILAHTIEAIVGETPARVHCNTCKSPHGYKPYEPGGSPRQVRQREAGGGLSPQPAKPRAGRYHVLLKGKDMALAKTY